MTLDSSSVVHFCKKLLQDQKLRNLLALTLGDASAIQALAEEKGCIISIDAADEIYRWSTGRTLIHNHSPFSFFLSPYPPEEGEPLDSIPRESKASQSNLFNCLRRNDFIKSGEFELDQLDISVLENEKVVYVLIKVVEEEREPFIASFDKPGRDQLGMPEGQFIGVDQQRFDASGSIELIKASYWRRSILAVWKVPNDLQSLHDAFSLPYYEWVFSEENAKCASVHPTAFVYGESCKGRGVEHLICDSKGNTKEVKPAPIAESFDDDAEIISYKFDGDGEPPFRLGFLFNNAGGMSHTDFLNCNLASFDGSDDELFEEMRVWLKQVL